MATMLACLSLALPLNAIALLWAAPSPAHASQGEDEGLSRQQRFEQLGRDLQRTFAALRVALAELPRHEFDVGARAEMLGPEPEAHLAFVRDETGWIAYQGMLRGARGTLMDRMGSHLDRALLLAHLLEAAGHEVRLARATLDDEAIAAIADLARAAPPALPRTEQDPQVADRATLEVAQRTGMDPGRLQQELFQAQTDAQRLHETLLERGFEQSEALTTLLGWDDGAEAPDDQAARNGDLPPATRAALADHWWVQVRTDEAWTDLDPVRAEHQVGDRLAGETAATLDLSDVPEADRHRLRIEVIAEKLEDGALERETALSHSVDAAALTGELLIINCHPVGWPADATLIDEAGESDLAQMRDLALRQDEWLPMINIGGDTIERFTIRADGSINRQPARTPTARAFGGAMGALAGARDRGPSTHLTAVTVQFTIESPGREAQRFDRPLMDLVGPSHRAAGKPIELELDEALRLQRSAALLGSKRLLGQSCWVGHTYAVGRTLSGMMENRQALLGAVHSASRDDMRGMARAMQGLRPQPGKLLALAHQRHNLSPHRDRIAIDGLNLLGYVNQPGWGEDGPVLQEGFDIIHNAVTVLPGQDVDARAVRLMQGVLETNLEAALHQTDRPIINTADQFAAAMGRGQNWRAIDDIEALGDAAAAIDADTRIHIEAALAAGHTIILAEAPQADQPLTWWRVDPATGDALGMGPDGRGSALLEHITLKNLAAAMTMIGLLACTPGTVGLADPACCLLLWGMGEAGALGLIAYVGATGPVAAFMAIVVAVLWAAFTDDFC